MISPLELALVTAALSDPLIAEKGYEASRVFAVIDVLLKSPSADRKSLIRKIKTAYLFIIDGKDGSEARWFVDMRKKGIIRKLAHKEKAPFKPDVVIQLGDADLVGLATGKLLATKLYAAKRIKLRGDIDRALKIETILSQERARFEELAPKAVDSDREKGGRWQAMPKAKL